MPGCLDPDHSSKCQMPNNDSMKLICHMFCEAASHIIGSITLRDIKRPAGNSSNADVTSANRSIIYLTCRTTGPGDGTAVGISSPNMICLVLWVIYVNSWLQGHHATLLTTHPPPLQPATASKRRSHSSRRAVHWRLPKECMQEQCRFTPTRAWQHRTPLPQPLVR